jgi:N-succinyldiaminopimelate aminotransferase
VAFCRALPATVGVAAIPVSAFYDGPGAPRHLVRFAFCKEDATLEEGLRRLRKLKA